MGRQWTMWGKLENLGKPGENPGETFSFLWKPWKQYLKKNLERGNSRWQPLERLHLCIKAEFQSKISYLLHLQYLRWWNLETIAKFQDAQNFVSKQYWKCSANGQRWKKRQTLQTRLCYFSQLVLFLGPERGNLCVKSALLTLLSTPELSAPSRFPCCVFFYLVMKHSRRWRPPICGSKMFEPYFRQ